MGIDRARGHPGAPGRSRRLSEDSAMPRAAPGNCPRSVLCSVPGWCVSEDMEATRAEAKALCWRRKASTLSKTYLFTVESDAQVHGSRHFPARAVAAARYQDRLRLSGDHCLPGAGELRHLGRPQTRQQHRSTPTIPTPAYRVSCAATPPATTGLPTGLAT